jgi:polysaccharide export outer membrane protein
MRSTRLALLLSVALLSVLLVLNLRAQYRTQEKIDALTAALAVRPDDATRQVDPPPPPAGAVPRELSHVVIPSSPYIIEAPDVLTIEAVLKKPELDVVERLPTQPISGQFLVRPDGTVGLGFWGSVSVSGLTLEQAAEVIRKHLAKSVESEKFTTRVAVSVDVLAYNSKVCYVITDAPGGGQDVARMPLTGNETVLDALANVPVAIGLKKRIWVARQTSGGAPQTLPVDWKGITEQGVTTTNYQLLPSDRVYVTASRE